MNRYRVTIKKKGRKLAEYKIQANSENEAIGRAQSAYSFFHNNFDWSEAEIVAAVNHRTTPIDRI